MSPQTAEVIHRIRQGMTIGDEIGFNGWQGRKTGYSLRF